MRPIVNLASNPFRNQRLFWLSLLALVGLSAWFGLNAIEQKVRLENQLLSQEETLRRLQGNVNKPDPQEPIKTVTITPDKNRELVEAGELIERRAFSWSQLLNDLERHIPAQVRVLRIAVNRVKVKDDNPLNAAASEERVVLLTLEVVGKSTTDVTRMITDFERTGIFTVNPRERKQIEGLDEVQFTLEVEYFPPVPRGLRASATTQLAENRK
jgi:Tfp pilus assembly protein PilN